MLEAERLYQDEKDLNSHKWNGKKQEQVLNRIKKFSLFDQTLKVCKGSTQKKNYIFGDFFS